jgi:hypothetical protein
VVAVRGRPLAATPLIPSAAGSCARPSRGQVNQVVSPGVRTSNSRSGVRVPILAWRCLRKPFWSTPTHSGIAPGIRAPVLTAHSTEVPDTSPSSTSVSAVDRPQAAPDRSRLRKDRSGDNRSVSEE